MKKQPYYDWDSENGIATCILSDGINIFLGTAQCHPDDKDFISEKTGMLIAEERAFIKSLQHYKNNEIKPELKALNQLYYSIKHSKKYNPKSYEAKMLKRQIKIKEMDLQEVKEMIYTHKGYINKFIADKDEFYERVRNNRAK